MPRDQVMDAGVGSTSLFSACGRPGVEPRRSVSAFGLAGADGRCWWPVLVAGVGGRCRWPVSVDVIDGGKSGDW